MFQSSAIVRLRKSGSNSALNRLSLTSKVFLLLLLTSGVLWLVRGANSAAKSSPASKGAITIQAAGRGKPYLNFQDGREVSVNYHGNENATRALQSGQARARALASADLDGNATPDLVVGYAYGGGGIVTVQSGNQDAFAPRDDSVFVRMQQGYNPDALLPGAQTYQVPEPVDFIQAGDFNHDNRKDVLVATRGGDLFLLAGDGEGGLRAPEQIDLPGTVTTLAVGEFRAADGQPDVAVGVAGPNGARLLIYDGAEGGLTATPMEFPLVNEATAVQFGGMDTDPFMDIAVAAGNEIDILHGWGRKFSPALETRVERVSAPSEVVGMAIGRYLWDRQARQEIAVLSGDGTVSILQPEGLETRAYTDDELFAHNRGRFKPQIKINDDVEAIAGWKSSDSGNWSVARTVVTSAVAGEVTGQSRLTTTNVASRETEDVVVAGSRSELNIVRQINPQADARSAAQAAATSTTGDMAEVSLGSAEAPVAVLQLPTKLNGERDLVVLQAQSLKPTIVPLVATSITVDRTDDPNGVNLAAASVCNGALANDCSLRGAVQFANIAANSPTTINLPAGTYTLATNGASQCDGNTVGDLGINLTTTIAGAGAATTIIRQHGTTDGVMCLNEGFLANLTYNFNGVTIIGGRLNGINTSGAGIIGGEQGNNVNFNNSVVANNIVTGGSGQGGGGILIQGGNLTITSSTIGGANNSSAANRDDTTTGNSTNISGGGVSYGSGMLTLPCPCVGTFTSQTTSTFSHNDANSATDGGGGLDLLGFNGGTGSANVNGTTFSNNRALGTASGGGLILESTLVTTVGTSTFSSNSAGNKGGAIFTAGGTLTLDGTSPTLTLSGNTATVSGSSLGINNNNNPNPGTTVTGSNFSIDGSVDVLTNGFLRTNAGSTWSLTDLKVFGTFDHLGTALNITGDLLVGIETGGNPGGHLNLNSSTVNLQGNLTVNNSGLANPNNTQFNGGTSTFNFTGGVSKAINANAVGTTVFNFANLVVNKPAATLTANTSASIVGGNLTVTAGTFDLLGNTFNRTVNAGTLTVSNGATLKIGGTNTVPSNYATHSIGATSTIEYEGTSQTVAVLNSSQNYGNLVVSGSGTKSLGGAIGVTTALTINGGTLDATASNFNIDDAGNWTNNVAAANFNPRAATVTFSSGAQNINGSATSQTFNNITMNDTSLTIGGSTTTLTLNGNMLLSAGTLSAGTATAINIAGNWTNNIAAAAFTAVNSTVTFNSTTAGQSINGSAASQTFNNLTVNKTGQILSTGGSTTQLDLNNTFNLSAGTFTAPATMNVAGDWTEASGTTFTPGSGIVTFSATGVKNLNGTATTQTFNNLVFNKGGGGSVTGGGSTATLTINGGVTLTAGTFSAGTITAINLPGDWTNNGGTFTPGSSNVTFNSSAAGQNINGSAASQTFNSITVNKTGQTLIMGGSTTTLTLNGSLTLTAGTLGVGTNTLTLNGAVSTGGGTLTSSTTGTVNYNQGSNGQATVLAANYGNLTFSNFNKTLASSGTIGIAGTFTPGTGAAHTITGSTINFNGAGSQNIPGFTYNNLTSSGGGVARILDSVNTIKIAGTFTPGTDTYTITGSTIEYNGGAAQILPSSGFNTYNNLTLNNVTTTTGFAGLTVNGLIEVKAGTFTSSSTYNNVQIDSGATLAATAASTINVSGNWTNNGGTFTANTSTVNLNGAGAQTIGGTGTTTFNNLTVSNATPISMNNDNTVNGVLALTSSDITVASTKTLTQPSTAGASTGTFDVIGNLKRTGAPLPNSALTYGNPDNVITLAGSTLTSLTVNLTKSVPTDTITGITNSGFPGAVQRTYLITEVPGGAFTPAGTTLQLHYLTSELSGNSEATPGPPASLRLYRYVISNPGTGWQQQDFPSGSNTSLSANHFVKVIGIKGFSPWTMANSSPTAATGSIGGTITDGNGTPISGATINLSGTQSRETITDSDGNYNFFDVETNGFYTVTPSRVNYIFSPANRSFSLLGVHTEASFSASANGDHLNAIDTTEFFVRQQYLDFLDREPDPPGFTGWVNTINNCAAGDTSCDRVHVSEMFFRSEEFQQRGYFVYRFYSTAFGRKPDFAEFTPDMARVSGFLTNDQLEAAKAALANDFVTRPAFAQYATLTNAQYVDALSQTAGVSLSNRQALVDSLEAGTLTRAQVLRQIAESGEVSAKYYNQAFVVMEYFGYLRRDPDILYRNWIQVLDQTGDPRQMVEGFVDATEYRNRFKQ
jgi:hypothetical protein